MKLGVGFGYFFIKKGFLYKYQKILCYFYCVLAYPKNYSAYARYAMAKVHE